MSLCLHISREDIERYIAIDEFDLKPEELLFIDDNIDNIDGAKRLGINTIKVNKGTNLYSEIIKFLNCNSK